MLSEASPFSRTAAIPAGQVSLRDVAGLYVYENTLDAKLLTGAQVKDYLEWSATYFVQTAPDAPVDVTKITNANNTPDYSYDVLSGVSYDIDIAQPAGSRISNLTHGGQPVDPAAQFVLAVNNYRSSGGSNYPHVAAAQSVWSNSDEIRNTIIAWVQAKGDDRPVDLRRRPVAAHPRRSAAVLVGTSLAAAPSSPKVVNAVLAGSG